MPGPEFYIQGAEELADNLESFGNNLNAKRLLNEVGLFLRTRILERTAAGEDVHGQRFEFYSPRYEALRRKKGLPTDKVDLFFTGSMLSSITFETTDEQVTLFFEDTQDKFGGSNPEKAYHLHQNREFFAMSADDLETIQDVARQYVRQALKGNRKRRR